MQNKPLAQWLQDHTDMLGSTADPKDSAFHRALFEGLIDLAQSGETRMVDSVVESAAAHAVAVGRQLTDLLGVHQRLRRGIWDRIREEIDPEPAFDMLTDLDSIFVHVIRVTIDAYQTGVRLAQAAKSTEISRLYSESEQKVMKYATEVSRANRELARLEQAKTDFISIAAHELKTPLTLIQGYVDILHGMDIDEQGKTLAAGIDRGVQRMDRILDDMLDLSAMDMRKLQLILRHVNLEKIIQLIIAQSERGLNERGQTITTHGLSALPDIEADTNRLHQVLRQLVNNAIKYTPDGGTIAITGESLGPARDEITGVRITISDTGVGIAPEHRAKIFEKFYRASDSSRHSTGQTKFMGAGPGLGLAIVKGLVEAHGGRVSAESPGFDMQNFPGSKFVIDLPCKANPPAGIGVQWIGPVRQSTRTTPEGK